MRVMAAMTAVAALAMLAGCGDGTGAKVDERGPDGNQIKNIEAETRLPAAVANTTTPTPSVAEHWVGTWTGVEGTTLKITPDTTPGHYKLAMQYTLDDKGVFDGTATGDGITFTRPDGPQVLRASNGDATGLKYLAGKKDCLMVKQGEGYCRD